MFSNGHRSSTELGNVARNGWPSLNGSGNWITAANGQYKRTTTSNTLYQKMEKLQSHSTKEMFRLNNEFRFDYSNTVKLNMWNNEILSMQYGWKIVRDKIYKMPLFVTSRLKCIKRPRQRLKSRSEWTKLIMSSGLSIHIYYNTAT